MSSYLKAEVSQPGGTHPHFHVADSALLTGWVSCDPGHEEEWRREKHQSPPKIKNLKSLTQVHQTS